jgi:hypothetical protein
MPPVEAGLLATGPVSVNQALIVVSDGPVSLKNLVIKCGFFSLRILSLSSNSVPVSNGTSAESVEHNNLVI